MKIVIEMYCYLQHLMGSFMDIMINLNQKGNDIIIQSTLECLLFFIKNSEIAERFLNNLKIRRFKLK